MSDFGLTLVAHHPTLQPNSGSHVNLVFVHGLGPKAEEAWHHPASGKTWNQDVEFLSKLAGPVRVWAFTYNSDIPANISAACIAFHADDLLFLLSNALQDGHRGPIIFVAHSWGGVIVKKALQLSWLMGRQPTVGRLTTGVIFGGTPHVHDKPENLRKALLKTIQAVDSSETTVDDCQIREYITAVSKVNRAFFHLSTRPSILSVWEDKAIGSDQVQAQPDDMVVPPDCRIEFPRPGKSAEKKFECDHVDLLRFPGLYDTKFMTLLEELNYLIGVAREFFSLLPPPEEPDAPPEEPKAKSTSEEKPQEPPLNVPPPLPLPSGLSETSSDMYQYWKRKSYAQDMKASEAAFLGSLKGWSEINIGNHITPAPGTCLWATEDATVIRWREEPVTNRMIIMGPAGCGKTHLLRALQEQFQVAEPDDTVLSFFCSPGSGRPPLWDYFTWALLQKEPWLFEEMPPRYRGKCDKLELGSFVDIWHAFRQANPNHNIWLLVDGLEQCNEEHFEDFLSSYLELFARPLVHKARRGAPQRDRSALKIVFTCRPTPAVIDAQASAARIFLESKTINKDISAYVDRKLDLVVDMEADRLEMVRDRIKKSAMLYWPYAIYAAQAVQEDLLFGAMSGSKGSDVHFLEEQKVMPAGLRKWYSDMVLPHIQSAGSFWLTRTALNILASQTYKVLLTVRQFDSVLRCLSNGEYTKQADVMLHLMTIFGDFLLLRPSGSMSFIHPSARWYMNELLSEQQRHVNMAFLCLKYLLQDQFAEPFELGQRGETAAERDEWLEDTYPFYDYAGAEWTLHLRKSGALVAQLMPLVREFVGGSSPQTRTWAEWRAPTDEHATRHVEPEQYAVALLVGEGCKNVLEHLFSCPHPVPWHSHKGLAAWGTALSSIWTAPESSSAKPKDADLVAATHWPDVHDMRGQNALMRAVFSGCIDTVQLIMSYKPDLEALSDLGDTALMCSLPPLDASFVEKYDCGILDLLLQKGADPNICHSRTWTTCLHQSCTSGLIEPTRLLLQHSAHIDAPDVHGVTPLQCAYRSENPVLVQELLYSGADPDIWWQGGITALDRCIHDGKLDMFQVLLDRADVNASSRSGLSPIHVACLEPDRLAFLELLLMRPDVDVNRPVKTFWGTARRYQGEPLSAISIAAHRGDFSVVELLLQAGADTEPAPGGDFAPLHYAAGSQSVDIARLLLEHNARVNIVGLRGTAPQTPLGIAVSKQDDDMVNLLLQHGADPTAVEGYGGEPVLVTAFRGRSPSTFIVEKLLKARVTPTVNPPETAKGHPMVLAARTGHVELVRLFLDHGADLGIWSGPVDGVSPLQLAIVKGHQDVVEFLLEREPRLLNAQSEQGFLSKSALQFACQGAPSMVKFLLGKGALASQVSYHHHESGLLLACTAGDYDSIKALLEAAPEMVNRPSVLGEAPLGRACARKDLRIMELLLQSGADMMHMDAMGVSSISPQLFFRENGPVDKKLELLMKYGLDLNAVVMSRGFTVLGVAIEYGYPNDVKWLIDHGADPSRCQRSPLEPIIWRNALHVACSSGRIAMVRLILELDWMSTKELRARDWLGGGVLPLGPARPWSVDVGRAIYSACEEERAKTGDDVFSELINHPCINGLSPVDWHLQPVGCSMSARRQLDDGIRHYLDGLLIRPRERATHMAVAEEAARLLLYRGGHDGEAEFLLSLTLSVTDYKWNPGQRRYVTFPIMACPCTVCGLYESPIAWICSLCMELCCDGCLLFEEPEALHLHRWVEIRLSSLWDWNSDRVQDRLEQLAGRFRATAGDGLSPIDEAPEEDLFSLGAAPDADMGDGTASDAIQMSLQLATLHAFNHLAIRRPLFTPHMPLNAALEATIAPWATLIGDQRRRVERANLRLESSPMRRQEEQSYLRIGLTRSYVDADDVRHGHILQEIQGLYREEPSLDHKQGRGGERREKNSRPDHPDDAIDEENDDKTDDANDDKK